MKIATYNIFKGGFGAYDNNVAWPPKRLNLIKQAVKQIDADFIGLVDSFDWDKGPKDQEIAKYFDYPFAKTIKLEDQWRGEDCTDTNLTVLTKMEADFESVSAGGRNFLKSQIELSGIILNIFTVYLDYRKDSTRLIQIKKLVEKITNDQSSVIMGDLNTFGAYSLPKEISALFGFGTRILGISKILPEFIRKIYESSVPKILTSHTFSTANIQHKPTAPTNILTKGILKPFIEIDYIFHNPGIKSSNFQIYTGGVFEKASDHYPISCEIGLI